MLKHSNSIRRVAIVDVVAMFMWCVQTAVQAQTCHFVTVGKTSKANLYATPTFCADDTTPFHVRCCSLIGNVDPYPAGGWSRQNSASCPYAASSNMYAGDPYIQGSTSCSPKFNYDDAVTLCQDASARLCTLPELEDDCTAHTGCFFNKEQLWTSTAMPPPPTTVPTLSPTLSPIPQPTRSPTFLSIRTFVDVEFDCDLQPVGLVRIRKSENVTQRQQRPRMPSAQSPIMQRQRRLLTDPYLPGGRPIVPYSNDFITDVIVNRFVLDFELVTLEPYSSFDVVGVCIDTKCESTDVELRYGTLAPSIAPGGDRRQQRQFFDEPLPPPPPSPPPPQSPSPSPPPQSPSGFVFAQPPLQQQQQQQQQQHQQQQRHHTRDDFVQRSEDCPTIVFKVLLDYSLNANEIVYDLIASSSSFIIEYETSNGTTKTSGITNAVAYDAEWGGKGTRPPTAEPTSPPTRAPTRAPTKRPVSIYGARGKGWGI